MALSNEGLPGADQDIPWALELLRMGGLVESYRIYSTGTRVAKVGASVAATEVATLVRELDADVLAFFHTGSCLFGNAELEAIRRANVRAIWIYHEGDGFQRWSLPYPRRAIPTVRRCQAAFLFCGGYLSDFVRRTSGAYVTYTPSWVNTDRFQHSWRAGEDFRHDVVFIGNNTSSRRRSFPGARRRGQLVALLQKRYGSRLGLYGRGWNGVGAMGTCAIDDASSVYRQSHACVGIDHVVGPYQFSNRLPIALACGIPLAHSALAGSSEMLPGMQQWQFFGTPRASIDVIDRILSTDPASLDEMSRAARGLAETLSCHRVMEYMLRCAQSIREGVNPRSLPNPWLAEADLRM